MSALQITAHDLASALSGGATFGKLSPVRWVEDIDTGERVGWMRESDGEYRWECGTFCGWARSEKEAFSCIREAYRKRRAWAREEELRRMEVMALPEPLRTLRRALDAAALNVEIERNRSIPRPCSLQNALNRLHEAEMAYAAAERQMAEAA